MNYRVSSSSVLAGFLLGTPLIASCASVQPREPPPAAPTELLGPSAASISSASAAGQPGVEPARDATRPAASSVTGDRVAMKSLNSHDGTDAGAFFAERRASEGLDRLSAAVAIRHERQADVITLLSDGLVEPGRWTITTTGEFTLAELASGLRDQEGHPIVIRAYTDSHGTATVNDALSLKRAEAVRDFLVTKGVAAESMRAEGIGARRPVAGNSTADGRAQNRRIEIVIAH